MTESTTDQFCLKNRPEPLADESLIGYLARLNQKNWFHSVSVLEGMTGVSIPKIALDTGGLDRVAELVGIDVGELEARQYARVTEGDNLRHFMGDQVHASHLRTTTMNYCRLCLGTEGYHQAIWDLRLVEACPRHAIILESTDPSTGKPISWRRRDLLAANYGDLPVSDEYGHQCEVDEVELFGQRALYERCGVDHEGPPVLNGLPESIAELALNDFVSLLIVLGAAQMKALEFNGTRRIYTYSVDVLDMTSAGVRMLLDWPGSLHNYLDERYKQGKQEFGMAGANRMFEDLFARMRKMPNGAAKSLLQQEVTEFLIERPISFNPKHVNFALGDQRVRWKFTTLQEAAKIMKVSVYRARAIAEAEGWIEPRKTDRRAINLIPRHLVENHRLEARIGYNGRELRTVLGLSKRAAQSVIRWGLAVPRDGSLDGRLKDVFLRSEVDDLLHRLRKTTESTAPLSRPENEIDIVQLVRRHRFPQEPTGLLLLHVLDGRIQPAFWDSAREGVYALRFDGARIGEFRVALARGVPESVPARIAGVRHGYSVEELAWFVQAGLLKGTPDTENPEDMLLSANDLRDFQDRYILERFIGPDYVKRRLAVIAESPTLGRVFSSRCPPRWEAGKSGDDGDCGTEKEARP